MLLVGDHICAQQIRFALQKHSVRAMTTQVTVDPIAKVHQFTQTLMVLALLEH